MIRMVAKELVDSLFRLAFGLDIPGGYQGTIYVLGRDIDEWADVGDGRVWRAGFECFADSKG